MLKKISLMLMLIVFVSSCMPAKCATKKDAQKPAKSDVVKPVSKEKCEAKTVVKYKGYEKVVIGQAENSYLPSYNVTLKARIDSGATTTSMHATNIVPFEREGKKWVRFEILNSKKEIIKIKKPITRVVSITRHGASDQKRYVVKMRINISSLSKLIEVSLTDRSKFTYPVLIGRNFLSGYAVVDVSKKYTRKPVKEKK